MCNYDTIKKNRNGYVIHCRNCGRIQVAFASVVLSLTRDQFYEFIRYADEQYRAYNLHSFPDQKVISIPTDSRSVSIIYSLNELKDLLHLLLAGRNKLEHEDLFAFHNN